MFKPSDYLDLSQTEHAALFENVEQVWEALGHIQAYLKFRLKPSIQATLIGKPFISDQVYLGEGTVVEPTAVIRGPAWIGRNCQIRAGAYIRENVIVGDNCVVGNSCELKNCVLFNGSQVPHFTYVGDSILGAKAHLAAGVILSNVKLDNGNVIVRSEGASFDTGLRKFGSIIGDGAEIGCNAVLNPGSLIGRHSLIYSGVQWRGILPADSVAKMTASYQVVPRRQM
jgi:NDP-sugar pyrophosphorylase family protein